MIHSEPEISTALYLLIALLSVMAIRGIAGGRTIFEYPTLVALLGLAWIIPQGISLDTRSYAAHAGGEFWLYVTGCFIFIAFGFRLGVARRKETAKRKPNPSTNDYRMDRLLLAAFLLLVVGAFAGYQMRGVSTAGMDTQWTGIMTVWALLWKANGLSLCLAVLVFARTGSLIALAIAIAAAYPLLATALVGVRREAIFDLAVLTAGAWYFAKMKTPPRVLVIGGIVAGTVILNTIGTIRSEVKSGETGLFELMTSTQTYTDFKYVDDTDTTSELALAQYDFWYMNETGKWEFGADHWNQLVHQYVPAFLVGRDFKEGLKVSSLSRRLSSGEEEGLSSLGSTRSGFSDSYRGFGVLGVLIFGLIGFLFGKLYAFASLGGISAQYFYLVLLAEGLKAITHGTAAFFAALPFTIIISLLVLSQAKSKKRSARRSEPLFLDPTGNNADRSASALHRPHYRKL